jgi:predicted amidohydrolase
MVIRIAQVRAYPISRDLEANHARLLEILDQVGEHRPDVVITPEGYLDGYIGKDELVTKENIYEWAIDPGESPYAESVAEWAGRHNAWFVFGCARAVPEGVYNSALIFDRSGELAGTYDKTHTQSHDKKYLPGQGLPIFGIERCARHFQPDLRQPQRAKPTDDANPVLRERGLHLLYAPGPIPRHRTQGRDRDQRSI